MVENRKGVEIERCYRLVAALLSEQPLDRRAIAQLLGFKEAAADRHIKALEAAKVPGVGFVKKAQKKLVLWRRDESGGPATRALASAACFGATLAQLFRGTAYETLLNKSRDDLIDRLKKKGDFKNVRRKFLFISRAGEVDLPAQHGLLDELVEAVLRQHIVEIDYTSFDGEQRKEKISPWSIAIYEHQLYVLAGVDAADLRPYRLSRIRSLRVLTTTTFNYPNTATYDPERLFRHSFGIFLRSDGAVEDVELRFDPRWRTYAQTHLWHATHQVIPSSGDGVVVRMRVRICNEFKAFILSFGGEVEVLSPRTLRASIAKSAASLATVYAASALHSRRSTAPTTPKTKTTAKGPRMKTRSPKAQSQAVRGKEKRPLTTAPRRRSR